jgi:iron complex transport system substrate-binding protein
MRRTAILVTALALIAAACGDSGTPNTTAPADGTFVGADGVSSTIADTSRIVALSGDLTETLFELGLGASVVAVDVTTVHPEAARGLPIVGVGRFLSAEAVLAQDPTLVIGDTQTSPPEAIEQIRSAGVPVLITEVPVTFEGLVTKIAALGDALGVPDEGQALADRVQADVADALATANDLDPAPGIAFVYSRGPDVMLLFGSEMTSQPMIEGAGGVDMGTASGVTGTVSVTPEAIIAAAPDVVITTSEGLEALGGVDGLLSIPGFADTPAGRNGAILDYPEGDFLTFGPRIADTLRLLIADLRAGPAAS